MGTRLRQTYRIIFNWVSGFPVLAIGLSFTFMLFFLVLAFIQLVAWGMFGPLPDRDELSKLHIPRATEIYAADSVLLGRFLLEDRRWVDQGDISEAVMQALVSTEDERFFQHDGVDERSLARVLVKNLILGDKSQGGGSTIHQQLAKNLYPREQYAFMSLVINKIRESIIAQELDEIYEKREILNLYLNTVSFGENAYGIETAAQRYFNISAKNLKAEQAALLIGMLKGTSRYNPRYDMKMALGRRNTVLDQMHGSQYISAAQADSLKALPVELNYHYYSHHDGLAPYFREKLRAELTVWAQQHFKADSSHYHLYKDGLKIYTTIDSRLQKYAEQAVGEHMQKLQRAFNRHWRWQNKKKAANELLIEQIAQSPRTLKWQAMQLTDAQIDSAWKVPVSMRLFTWTGEQDTLLSPFDSLLHDTYLLHSGFVAIDPTNGQVKAWVGGINHQFFQFDHVISRRQTGSVFKPLVYAAALESGTSPCEYIPNDKTTFARYDNWTPRNSDNIYGGEYSMKGALTHSVNVAAVNLILKIGPKKVTDLVKEMGIAYDIPAVPALALGAGDFSLLDMTNMYSCMINGGQYHEPANVTHILDSKGKTAFQHFPSTKQVISTETSSIITYMLENVVDEGTARGLRSRFRLPFPIAGKTGTTQSQSDGWFIGATPWLVAGAWVGANDRRIHFRTLREGQGAVTAMPIWGKFMQLVSRDSVFRPKFNATFNPPSPTLLKEMDCEEYWFPLKMSEFKEWYMEQEGLDELEKAD